MPNGVKSYAPRIPPSTWEQHRSRIKALFVDQNKTLSQVAEMMKTYGLYASESQYESQLRIWGIRKNLKRADWCRIARHLAERPANGYKKVVYIDGKQQPDDKIARELARSKYVSHRGLAPDLPRGVRIRTQMGEAPSLSIQDRMYTRLMGISRELKQRLERELRDLSEKLKSITAMTKKLKSITAMTKNALPTLQAEKSWICASKGSPVCISQDVVHGSSLMEPWSVSKWESVGVTSEEWKERGWHVFFGGWGQVGTGVRYSRMLIHAYEDRKS